MKALLIDPEKQSLEPIDIQGREDIAKLIGYDTIESDAVGTAGDRLYFDEECFLRGTQGRFQIDSGPGGARRYRRRRPDAARCGDGRRQPAQPPQVPLIANTY
jgi:hypothetical protein